MTNLATTFNPNTPHIIYEGGMEYRLGTLEGNLIQYDFAKVVKYLGVKGKLLFGKDFKLYEEDNELLLKLASYFVGDESSCSKYGLEVNRGLLLTGPVGCGKTTLMRLLPHITPHRRIYDFIPCRNIIFGINHLGHKIIEDYATTKPYCFNDLGVEQTGKHFGQDCNVMGEILISRYEIFKNLKPHNNSLSGGLKGALTHVTTNFNADELQEKYGERVRSRMREMFNLISFSSNSTDKRS